MIKARGFHENLRETVANIGGTDRSFGVTFAVAFAFLAAWPLTRADTPQWWAAIVSGGFLIIAVVRPSLLRPLNLLWMAFGRLLHEIVTPIVMAVLFYAAVTPIALLMRIFRKRPIPLAFDLSAKSYWIERRPAGPAPDTMKHQF